MIKEQGDRSQESGTNSKLDRWLKRLRSLVFDLLTSGSLLLATLSIGVSIMRLDTHLSQRMEQKMILAPRMIQSMEILQLPIMALQERIEHELQENPVLELKEAGEDEAVPADEAGRVHGTACRRPAEVSNPERSWSSTRRETSRTSTA